MINAAREVVFVDRFHRIDWNLQVNRIHAATERYNDAEVLVDSTGAGEPIFESLLEAGCNASPYVFTTRSKAALIDNLVLMLEQRLITLPRADIWPTGIEELEAFEFSITDSGNVRTSAPYGAMDDCVIGVCLSAWQLRPDAGDVWLEHELTW